MRIDRSLAQSNALKGTNLRIFDYNPFLGQKCIYMIVLASSIAARFYTGHEQRCYIPTTRVIMLTLQFVHSKYYYVKITVSTG